MNMATENRDPKPVSRPVRWLLIYHFLEEAYGARALELWRSRALGDQD
jgi:hypothetical protein